MAEPGAGTDDADAHACEHPLAVLPKCLDLPVVDHRVDQSVFRSLCEEQADAASHDAHPLELGDLCCFGERHGR